MQIRLAAPEELPLLLPIYDAARAYMRENGNMHQWTGGYPSAEVLAEDIRLRRLYLCVEGEEILAVFCYFEGVDPTYLRIDGAWQNDLPYGVVHRIAVTAHRRGVASFCYAWAYEKCRNLKIDTHADNIPMQKSLLKNGFAYCGIIYLANGDPRYAYQKV